MIPKKMWQALQPLIKDTQDKEINKLKIDEEIITNVEEIPNSLNVFYINSIEEVISKIDTTNCSIDNRDVTIGNDDIEVVEKIKYLGVIIDRSLSFKEYACKHGALNNVKTGFGSISVEKKRKRRAEYWVHPLNTRRLECGEYHRLCHELETYPARYFQYFRMSRNQFEKLHNMLEDEISKENTNYRDAISSRERLVVTLSIVIREIDSAEARVEGLLSELSPNSKLKSKL
ncbi:hypothetical protein NQ314_012812 [Rhamnusium bicolor]|uniref:Uncharacterized protein n=1 Tax=Rhamnusium bicolor TaxID=1586634 RepID=A0AAV8XA25_9CUCU|nr:hypothetical protein NQ314_012812 [Rhamnusium bicolor]